MSFNPYDWETEERRDSERFADASVFDGPDPSEYMDYPEDKKPEWVFETNLGGIENPDFEDGMPWQPIKPGMIDENAMLKGLLGMLFAVLASLMLWILIGAAVMRWILR